MELNVSSESADKMVMGLGAAVNAKWIKQFGISETVLYELGLDSPQTNPEALRSCLMNGKISEAEYLEWAMRLFELPAVSGDFFTAPSDPQFWEEARSLHHWNPAFFPLAKWEGIYLIACLEPPTEFKFPYPHRFVLASARHLLLLWDHLNPQYISDQMQPQVDLGNSRHLNPRQVAAGNDLVSDTFDMPDGIIINDALPTVQEVTESNSFLQGFDAPLGLDHEATLVAPRPKTPDGFSAAKDQEVPPLRGEPDGLVGHNRAEHNQMTPMTPMARKPEPLVAIVPVEEEGKVEVTATNFTLTAGGVRPLSSAHSLNSLGALALVHVMEHFEAAMVLLVDASTGALKPWKWSEALNSPKNADLTNIDLNLPSAFRVVFRSQQPYHGQMPTSALNTVFASAFTAGKLPIVTIVPAIEKKKWHGMVIGMTTQSRTYKQVLGPMSDIGDELAKQLARLSKTNAA
jgi:hypothetical protein